jgi:hypothetical protein
VSGPETTELSFRSTRLVRVVVAVCLAAELLFVFLDYHVNYGGLTEIGTLRRLTNIAREDSLGSWFGTTQTTLVALTLWCVFLVVRQQTDLRWRRTGWLVLACFFSVMAIDDGAMLHERAGTFVKALHDSDAPGGALTAVGDRLLDAFPSYAWQIVVLPFFALLGLFMLGFLWRELGTDKTRWFVVAALACFSIAVGLDFVEGLDDEHPWNLYTRIGQAVDFGDFTEYRFRRSPYDTLRHFSKSIEEFLEMLGNTLCWYVFLRTLTRVAADVRIRFRES